MKKKSILRFKGRGSFTQIPNHIINNKRLTLRAKGLFMVMLSKPDDWQFHEYELQTYSKDGREGTRKAMNDLISEGYVSRHRRRCPLTGQWEGWEYEVRIKPRRNSVLLTKTASPRSVKPSLGDRPSTFADFQIRVYGRTIEEAHAANICIDCGKPVPRNIYLKNQGAEYRKSGLCDVCHDALLMAGAPEHFKPYKLEDM
jgi:hypothetical protein